MMRPRGLKHRVWVGLVAATALVAAVFAGPVVSAPAKPFTATISPAAAADGSSSTYAYTITNASSAGVPNNQSLGSANIAIPSGWTVTSVSAVGPPRTSWSASINTSTAQIEVRSATQADRLSGGESVVVTIGATAPCTAGAYRWAPTVKQSNNFLGSGNDFFLDGTVPSVTVASGSGPLGSFAVATVASPQTAGAAFSVRATAYDTCGDVKTNYAGGASLSGTLGVSATAPAGDSTAPSYGAFGTWTDGSASASVTAKKADMGQTVTVSDGSATGTSNVFDVVSGPLAALTFSPVGQQVAGSEFTTTVTATDAYGNAVTGDVGATLSGLPVSPSGNTPSYSIGTWSGGQATASVTAYAAGSQTLTATHGSITGAVTFIVVPATLIPSFDAQPGIAQVFSPIYSNAATQAPVTVTVADAYGNVAPDGTAVTMAGPGGLQGTLSRLTTNGVATFDDLSLGTIGTYQLTAQVGSATATSTSFQVVTELKVCTDVALCEVTASNSAQSSGTTISSATGATFQSIILTSTFLTDPNQCAGFTAIPGTVGSGVEVVSSIGNATTSQPTFTITYTIQKSALKAANLDNLGASQFSVCLGAKRFAGTGAWIDAFGNSALFDSATGFYWGVVPNGSNSLPPTNPYIQSEHKDQAGNLVIVLIKPYPWDGWAYIG